ncbi:3-phosphoshikimate 1-carboxyvinyltransferase [bacterium]|nr:3-phosphoshikimate 1-carboxyvinyltransferase [bacterium]
MDKISTKQKTGLRGEIEIPSDKSVSHRSIIIPSLIKGGKYRVFNFSKGKDCISTLNLYKNLGIEIKYLDEKTLEINLPDKLTNKTKELFCGNSGTTMRLTSGVLAGQNFISVLTGDESLSKRTMKRIIEPLTQMGADITSENNTAPLTIKGTDKLKGIVYNSPLASAQVKSCILLAGLNADGKTTYTENFISRNHTENMLKYLGSEILTETTDKYSVTVQKSEMKAKDIYVPGDISSAAFFIVAALITPDSDIILKNVGLNPTRDGIINVAKRMGANIEILDKKDLSGEQIGDIRVRYSDNLKSTEISKNEIPALIDELPVIAVLATQAEGTTVIKDATDLRNKETDRITTTVNELKKLGADIEEREDGFIINGKTSLKGGAELNSYKDHRLAMSFYVAGLICEQDVLIKDFEWVNISFPEFEELITRLK